MRYVGTFRGGTTTWELRIDRLDLLFAVAIYQTGSRSAAWSYVDMR